MRKIPQLLNVKTPRIKQFSLYAFLVIEANAFISLLSKQTPLFHSSSEIFSSLRPRAMQEVWP